MLYIKNTNEGESLYKDSPSLVLIFFINYIKNTNKDDFIGYKGPCM
jgi:hypothetical protein